MDLKAIIKFFYYWARGSKRSYSQTGEDVVIDFYTRDITAGFYVDIGANHPTYLNNTYLFYKRGWKGVCIEPDPSVASMFKIFRRRDKVLMLGVGDKKEKKELFVFNPNTLSTFSAEEARRYKGLGHTLVGTKVVTVDTLANVLNAWYPEGPIHVVSIDTEGFDLSILQGNDWTKFRPWFVIVETVRYEKGQGIKAGKDIEGFMHGVGYGIVAHTFINTIFIDLNIAAKRGIVL